MKISRSLFASVAFAALFAVLPNVAVAQSDTTTTEQTQPATDEQAPAATEQAAPAAEEEPVKKKKKKAAEEQPAQEQAPAAEQAPAVEQAPAATEQAAPAAEEEPVKKKKKKKAAEEQPAQEQAPAAEQAPALEQAPAAEQAPAVEQAPAAEQAPAVEQAPAAEQAPAVEQAPAAEQAPAVEQAPSTEQAAPAAEEEPVKKKKKKKAAEEQPAQEQAPAAEQAPAIEQAPAAEQAPAIEQAPAAEQQPAQQEQAPAAAQQPAQQQPTAVAQDPVPVFTTDKILGDERPAAELTDADLRERIRGAEEMAASDQANRKQRKQLQAKAEADKAELNARIAATTGVAVQNIDVAKKVDELTGDSRRARDLDDDALRERIKQTRGLLSIEGLTDTQTAALRGILDRDSAVIRSRVAKRDEKRTLRRARSDAEEEGGNNWSDELPMRGEQLTLRDLMDDERNPDELTSHALERRIDANRRALRLEGLSDRQRARIRNRLEEDRAVLRDRFGNRRERRRQKLDDPTFQIAIAAGVIAGAVILSRPNIAVAEAYDEELEDWLTAPPLVNTKKRYRIEDFREQPRLRFAVPGVEVDTVRFGFGEGFLREEEVPKLERIGETIERIVAGNPDEVYLIEGHTDAVGTEEANMSLSIQRADAVKKALTEYFNIPEANLETVGRGELYPKIPTEAAEAENRRVSVRRITPLLARQ